MPPLYLTLQQANRFSDITRGHPTGILTPQPVILDIKRMLSAGYTQRKIIMELGVGSSLITKVRREMNVHE